jgi:hypothetical protein
VLNIQPFVAELREQNLLDQLLAELSSACGTSQLMASTKAGVGRAYPSGEMTGDAEYLVGDHTYKLHLPPKLGRYGPRTLRR